MDSHIEKIRSKRREFGKIFILSILFINAYFIGLIFLLPIWNYKPLAPVEPLVFSFFAILYVLYLFLQRKNDFWPIYKILAFFVAVLVFYFSLYIHHVSHIIFIFYVPLGLMILMLTNLKTAIITAFVFLLACFIAPYLSEYLYLKTTITESPNDTIINKAQDYVIMVFCIYFSFLTLYYYIQFNKIENNIPKKNAETNNEFLLLKKTPTPFTEDKKEPITRKTNELYVKITHLFEKEKLYTDPDFTMEILSKKLNVNSTYIYKAIKDNSENSFRDLVNQYRINQVLFEIQNQAHKKFTIEHIYLKAGFIQQSTFNRVFKKTTGLTPSEYIEKKKL